MINSKILCLLLIVTTNEELFKAYDLKITNNDNTFKLEFANTDIQNRNVCTFLGSPNLYIKGAYIVNVHYKKIRNKYIGENDYKIEDPFEGLKISNKNSVKIVYMGSKSNKIEKVQISKEDDTATDRIIPKSQRLEESRNPSLKISDKSLEDDQIDSPMFAYQVKELEESSYKKPIQAILFTVIILSLLAAGIRCLKKCCYRTPTLVITNNAS